MALHAHNAEDRAEQMIVLTQRLKGLIEKETAHFVARTPHKAASIAEEKNALATTYRLETSRIAKNPDLITNAPAPLRATLKLETQDLDKALHANSFAAGSARRLTEGLVHAIAEEAASNRRRMHGYGANGLVQANNSAQAITLNREI